jgi:acetyl-CoA synthetase
MSFDFGGEIAWRPSRDYIDNSRLTAFIQRHQLGSYGDLLRRSVDDPEWFWPAVLDDLGIEFYEPFEKVLDASAGIAWARWCVGGRMNIVHNCLDKWMGTDVERRVALRSEDEPGATTTLTYAELARDVGKCANALRSLGIGRGDRVALFMPMCPELVVALFAAIKLGAVVLPLFSGYGPEAVAVRLRDADVAVMFTADGFWRRGQRVGMKMVANQALDAAPSVRHVVVASRIGVEVPMRPGRDHHWSNLVGRQDSRCDTERTAADDPLMIIYTSGTTGRPKGAVHTHCGFPVKSAQDMAHAFDVHPGECMYWVTDIGWMMGPWELLGVTLMAGTIVAYDGALDHPTPDRLWSIVARHQVNILGVSPTLVRSLMRHGDGPVNAHSLESLRILGSTGEPWDRESWRWLFDVAGKGRLPIINYSGGTEVSGGLVGGNVLTALKPASFAGPIPGIAADVVDDSAQPLRNQVGELVVRAPWIGMTRGFWRDAERYEETYFTTFPGLWRHGDWAAIDEEGLWYILGRSDDTIKIAGKRLGPAEVESVLAEHPSVVETAAIGVPDELKGQALVCFCVLKPDVDGGAALAGELTALIVNRLGKPLRPRSIEFVSEIPKTRNAKVMRRVIRAAYLGEPLGDLSSLENPRAVEAVQRVTRRG